MHQIRVFAPALKKLTALPQTSWLYFKRPAFEESERKKKNRKGKKRGAVKRMKEEQERKGKEWDETIGAGRKRKERKRREKNAPIYIYGYTPCTAAVRGLAPLKNTGQNKQLPLFPNRRSHQEHLLDRPARSHIDDRFHVTLLRRECFLFLSVCLSVFPCASGRKSLDVIMDSTSLS